MELNYLEAIICKIELVNPNHASKIRKNLNEFSGSQINKANSFVKKYNDYLISENKTLDFSVECYLRMMDDMTVERIEFIRNGRYTSSSFDEVEKRVYDNPDTMTYHMHGLVLAQFLWYDQFIRFIFFSENFNKYVSKPGKYLEIGGGHGLYINEAIELLPEFGRFDIIDISQSSIELAKGILRNERVNFIKKNIFDFDKCVEKYNFITAGEILEHMENPSQLLIKIYELLDRDGICYITTPINAPMIDHIYLFNNETEIREIIIKNGFEIMEEKSAISDNATIKFSKKYKSPVMYSAFIKKKNI